MADWSVTLPPTPGRVEPGGPKPTDPGWRDWVAVLRDQVAGPDDRLTVTFESTSGGWEWRAIEGDAPSPWTREPVTFTKEKPYEDFTRFERTYPRLVLIMVAKVTVVVHFRLTTPEGRRCPGASGRGRAVCAPNLGELRRRQRGDRDEGSRRDRERRLGPDPNRGSR